LDTIGKKFDSSLDAIDGFSAILYAFSGKIDIGMVSALDN
jgi:hypothetical protein